MRENIRFGMNVVRAEFDADSQGWLVEAVSENGESQKLFANIIISAVGAFDRPKLPSISGLEDFNGPVVHTADWDDELELAGKRGRGNRKRSERDAAGSAVAGIAESMWSFNALLNGQRRSKSFRLKCPMISGTSWRQFHPYQAWYRARLGWIFNDRVHASLQKDPEWKNPERSVKRDQRWSSRVFHPVSRFRKWGSY